MLCGYSRSDSRRTRKAVKPSHCWLMAMQRNSLVPKLQLGNAALEAPASRDTTSWSLPAMGSQAGAWEPAKFLFFYVAPLRRCVRPSFATLGMRLGCSLVPKLQLSSLYTSPADPKTPSFRHGLPESSAMDGNLPLAQVLDSVKLPAPRFTSL